MATGELSDEQVFGRGYTYGPGATESGQPVTQPQADYARAMATARDPSAPVGTAQNPSYDTPTRQGDQTVFHVTPEGRVFDPVATAQAQSGVRPSKELSDADVFGSDFRPGQTFDTRPVSQSLGIAEGAGVVGKNLASLLSPLLDPSAPMRNLANATFARKSPIPDLTPTGRLADLAGGEMRTAEKTYRPGAEGKTGAEIALTLPLAAMGEGAPFLTGALQGALTSEAPDGPGRLRDIGLGALGGKAGSLIGGAASTAAWPTIRPEAQWALDNGIRLTPGAIAGGAVQGIESGAAKGTIAGPMVSNAQRQMITDANLAAVNNALKPAGMALPAGVPAGTAAIDKAHTLFGQAYDDLAPKLTLTRDPEFDQRLSELAHYGADLDPSLSGRYQGLLDKVTSGFDANGRMPGPQVRKLDSYLGLQQRRFGQSQDPFHQEYADAISGLQDTLRDATERSNPAFANQLSALNSGYSQLVRLDKAALLAKQSGGVWTPDQLMQAATSRGLDNSARQTSSARGQALLQDWAQSAKDVLPKAMPNAGNFWTHLPELAVTAGVGHESGLHAIGGLLAAEGALAGAYTPAVQSVLRASMTQRPAAAESVADIVRRLTPYFAGVGALGATKGALPALQANLGQTP